MNAAGDSVTEATGGGTDTVLASIASYTLPANVENLTYTGAGNFNGTGNDLTNVITGGGGADTLSDGGVGAADRLIGGAGDDTYIVHNAGDIITETATGGTDTVKTTLNSYTLGNNLENLTFIGTGVFTGTGDTGANVITGGAGADILTGGGGGIPSSWRRAMRTATGSPTSPPLRGQTTTSSPSPATAPRAWHWSRPSPSRGRPQRATPCWSPAPR